MRFWKALIALILYGSLSFSPVHATIRVGIVMFYPPFVMSDGDGFDVEFIKILCRRMQQNCELAPMAFHKLFTALDNGQIDIAIGGITIPLTRTFDYLYTLPYMLSKGNFLVLKTTKAKTIADLAGTTLGIIKGRQDAGVFFDFIMSNYPNTFQIQRFDGVADVITALSNGSINAAFIHESTALYWQQNDQHFKILGNPQRVGNGIAIVALPTSYPLIRNLNQQIQAIEQQGVYLNLYLTYFSNDK